MDSRVTQSEAQANVVLWAVFGRAIRILLGVSSQCTGVQIVFDVLKMREYCPL